MRVVMISVRSEHGRFVGAVFVEVENHVTLDDVRKELSLEHSRQRGPGFCDLCIKGRALATFTPPNYGLDVARARFLLEEISPSGTPLRGYLK